MRKYGYKRDKYHPKDIPYKAQKGYLATLPKAVDLRPSCPVVRDQGPYGSCTAFGITGMLKFEQMRQGLPDFPYSEMFLYYCERDLEGDPGQDGGAEIRDGINLAINQGVCGEDLWPYDGANLFVKPSDACYQNALQHKGLQYQRIPQDLQQMKACLAEGYPFVFGIAVYQSFERDTVAQTGVIPMPVAGEQELGGHCAMCVGYGTYKRRKGFWCQNSWSTNWGVEGYFFIPEAYFVDPKLSGDFWTIRTVE